MPDKEKLFTNGYALLIGVGNYENESKLPITVNDATVLYKLLTNPDRAGYPKDQVKLLVNEDASRIGIMNGLDWLIKCTAKDPLATVMIYFSGHGGIKEKQYILIPNDFHWGKWKELGITKEEFAEKIEAIRNRKLMVLLDCCHAAGIATKSSIENEFSPSNEALYEQLKKGVGRVVVASSRHDQLSYILPNAPYSVFTDALVRALDAHGSDGSNYATVLRTFTYVSEQVKKAMNCSQTPVFNMDNLEDFIICRVNIALANKQPFEKTADYMGADNPNLPEENLPVTDLESFRNKIIHLLDEQGFAAIPAVLQEIEKSGYSYNKPAFANLRNDAMSNLAMLSPNDYITRLKVFIGMLK
jgi:hypothetical protein